MVHVQAREDLKTLLWILPQSIRAHLEELGREDELLEVVMDLGRAPTARYVSGDVVIRVDEVTRAEIDQVVEGYTQPAGPSGGIDLPGWTSSLRHYRYYSRDCE
jgi:hypothetical protein